MQIRFMVKSDDLTLLYDNLRNAKLSKGAEVDIDISSLSQEDADALMEVLVNHTPAYNIITVDN